MITSDFGVYKLKSRDSSTESDLLSVRDVTVVNAFANNVLYYDFLISVQCFETVKFAYKLLKIICRVKLRESTVIIK